MKYRALFYSSAVALPLAALALTGAHAATTATANGTTDAPKWGQFEQANLTDAQKAAVEQAQALMKQAQEILEKAGVPARHMKPAMHRIELTAEQKTLLEQAKALREQGKNDEAKALLEKAGIPAMRKGPMHMGRGMGSKPAAEVK
jgi:tetratricopeptide (TPR) repeat protein